MSKGIVTFGEIMLRLAPYNYERFVQTNTFQATYGGGEANVAVDVSGILADNNVTSGRKRSPGAELIKNTAG